MTKGKKKKEREEKGKEYTMKIPVVVDYECLPRIQSTRDLGEEDGKVTHQSHSLWL